MKKNNNILRMPSIVRNVGIACLAFLCWVILYILFFQFENCPLIIIYGGLIFFPLSLLMLGINWRIEIQQDGFVYRNFWRKKKYYKYSEIEIRLCSQAKTFLYKDNKKVLTIPYYIEDGDKFIKLISKKRKHKPD